MLFDRYHTEFRKRSFKKHINYFNFRSKIQMDQPVLLPDPPVQHAIRYEALLRMKVLVVVGAHHAVRVHHDAVFLQEEIDVRVEAFFAALA